MDFSVSFNSIDEQSIPLVIIDGKQLHLVTYAHNWSTRTELPTDGQNSLVVSGYFEGSVELHWFYIDVDTRMIKDM